MDKTNPSILVLYHFHRPDDVAGAQQFTGLAEGLSGKGWQVEAWPSNRACHSNQSYPTRPETLKGVTVKRVWRPPLSQHSFIGRVLNAVWMLKAWWWRLAFSSYRPDVILLGTDPILSVMLAPWLKAIRPQAKIAHWCFDLYPEAAVADGAVKRGGFLADLASSLARRGYTQCDLIADLGPCMRALLENYPGQKRVTLTPWALEEPHSPLVHDPEERRALFGDAKLGLLYSGNLGRAHDFYLTLKLARLMKGTAVFNFSARGGRMEALRIAVNTEDANVKFGSFAPPEKLTARLSSPDIHIVSLKPEWTGTVVPSKFFGALGVGRPVLFEGSANSSIAQWIERYQVGWVLRADNVEELAGKLLKYSGSGKEMRTMTKRCHDTYQAHFSKRAVIEAWDQELKGLL